MPPGTGAVGKLRNDLYIACAAFWTAVSYWGAAVSSRADHRRAARGHPKSQGLATLRRSTLELMTGALDTAPDIDQPSTPEDLHTAATRVLDTVEKSLNLIGSATSTTEPTAPSSTSTDTIFYRNARNRSEETA